MHHFQLKPVRSLDSLRPAWSGHLRHGPLPSTVITNPRKISSTKQMFFSSSSHPLPPNNSINQSKRFTSNSVTTKSNSTVEIDEMSPSPVLPVSHNQNAQPNLLLHELHVHNDFTNPVVNLPSRIHKNEDTKSVERFFPNDTKVNSKNSFRNADSIPNTCTYGEPFDRPFKTSNFLHEVNEDDPFDTSRVFMPTYLQRAAPLFKSTILPTPVQFHPLSHPFNTTSCSAQAKVNIIVHYLLFL